MNGDYERDDCHEQRGLTARPRDGGAEWTVLRTEGASSGTHVVTL